MNSERLIQSSVIYQETRICLYTPFFCGFNFFLCLQVTFGLALVFVLSDDAARWIVVNWWVTLVASIVAFATIIGECVFPQVISSSSSSCNCLRLLFIMV